MDLQFIHLAQIALCAIKSSSFMSYPGTISYKESGNSGIWNPSTHVFVCSSTTYMLFSSYSIKYTTTDEIVTLSMEF